MYLRSRSRAPTAVVTPTLSALSATPSHTVPTGPRGTTLFVDRTARTAAPQRSTTTGPPTNTPHARGWARRHAPTTVHTTTATHPQARIEELLDEDVVERELALLSPLRPSPFAEMGDMPMSAPGGAGDGDEDGQESGLGADELTFPVGLSPSVLMEPALSFEELSLEDLDFGMLPDLPDGDFPDDIDSLLPPTPTPTAATMGEGDGARSARSDGGAVDGMDLESGPIMDDIEFLGDHSDDSPDDSPFRPFSSSTAQSGSGSGSGYAAAGGGSASGGPPGPMAIADKAALFSGKNPLSLNSVFPNAGARFSPLRQFQMLDAKQQQQQGPPGAMRVSGNWDNTGSALARSGSGSELVPYPYDAGGNASAFTVKHEMTDDDFDVQALEYPGWDNAQREKIRLNPPQSMKTITDFELAYVDLKQLNALMDKDGYTEEQKKQAKLRRRKVKNRTSAKGSATKKRTQYNSIAQTNKQLLTVVSELQNRNTKLTSANSELQQRTEEAQQLAAVALHEKEVFQHEIDRLTSLLSQMQSQSPLPEHYDSP
eukprot:m.213773 g.213773  ORF g.213773 m.213773 type:complete len:542 (-) comp25567_c0_seq1:516-2141(-)